MKLAERSRNGHRYTFAVLLASVSSFALLQSLVVPVLATIQHDLRTSQNSASWVLTAYLLSASVFTPIVGRMGDTWGKQRMLLVVTLGLAAGSVISALSGSLTVMLIGRSVQGVGGGIVPLSFGIIRDEFPRDRVGPAIGALAGLTGAGSGLGLVLAGPIVDSLSYRWLFWFPVITLSIAALGIHLVVPESPNREPGRINWLAAALLSGWLCALLLPLSEAPVWGWSSPTVIVLFLISAVLVVMWVAVERRSDSPLIDLKMMGLPAVWSVNLVAVLLGVGLFANYAFMPQLLETPRSAGYGFGASIIESGLVLLPSALVMLVAGLVSGRVIALIGSRSTLLVGAVIGAVPFVILSLSLAHLWLIVVAMALQGGGFGLAFASMAGLIVEGVSASQTGVAVGMNTNLRIIGGSFGAAAMTSVVTATVGRSGLPTAAGYRHGYLLISVAAIGSAAAVLFVPRARAGADHLSDRQAAEAAELALLPGGAMVLEPPE